MSSNDLTVNGFDEKDIALIRDTVARGATPQEFQLFLARCKLMKLNPLKPGQIHFVKYGSGPGSVVVGIEGFRSIAARTGKLSGIKRGAIKDEKGVLIGGWAEVYRSDWQHPAREEAPLAEYKKNTPIWRDMTETMIKKVAEAAALRMAFPDDLGGLYAPEEIDPNAASRVVSDQPEASDGVQREGYTIPYETFAKKRPQDCDPERLRAWVIEKTEEARERGKIGRWVKEAIDHCVPVLEAHFGPGWDAVEVVTE
jgi:phage recombination protein Bet